MSSATPTRIQQVLIYFGLADDPSETEAQRRRSEWPWLVAMPFLLVMWVRGDHHDTVALVVGALLLPAFALGLGLAFRVRPALALQDRHPDLSTGLVVPGTSLGFAWLLVPDAQPDWVPVAIAGAITAAWIVTALLRRFTAD